MASKSKTQQDGTRGGDTVEIVVRNASGDVVRTLNKGEILSEARKIEVLDQLAGEGKDALEERAEADGILVPGNASVATLKDLIASRAAPMGIGAVLYEGTPQEIKGPGPEWEKDDNGGYPNRG